MSNSYKLILAYGVGSHVHPPWERIYEPLSNAFGHEVRESTWFGVVPHNEREIANMIKAELKMQAEGPPP